MTNTLLKSIRQFKKSRGETYAETAERIRHEYPDEAAHLDRLELGWMTGGARKGSGRKPSPPELKKIQVGLKLPRWLVEWMRARPESQARLIEDALQSVHGLKPPDVKKCQP